MRPGCLAFGPLEDVVRARGGSLRAFQGASGINPARARREGVTLTQAENGAHAVGCHPTELWPDDYLWLCTFPAIPAEYGTMPEPEPGDRFCGRRMAGAS